jgi:hypothetical protein
MVPGRFRTRAESAAFAALLIIGGWSFYALLYILCIVVLAIVSAAVLDQLLRVTSRDSTDSGFSVSNPWLIAGLGIATVAVAPTLVISEYAPPIMLLFYPVFLAYFSGELIKEYVEQDDFEFVHARHTSLEGARRHEGGAAVPR